MAGLVRARRRESAATGGEMAKMIGSNGITMMTDDDDDDDDKTRAMPPRTRRPELSLG
jgi:hypothetical protein